MSNLPQTAHPANAGSAENPYIRPEFSIHGPVPSHLRFRNPGKPSHTPIELDGPEFEPSIRKVWKALDDTCVEFKGDPVTWKSARTLGEMIPKYEKGVLTHYKERAVQAALNLLVDLGYIARVTMPVYGQPREVIVCLWRLSPISHGRGTLNVGGAELDVDKLDPVRRFLAKPKVSLPPGSAEIRPEAAIRCARLFPEVPVGPQESAPEYGIELRELTRTLTSAPLRGEEIREADEPATVAEPLALLDQVEADPAVIPAAIVEPIAPVEADPTVLIASARGRMLAANPRVAYFVAADVWHLIEAGLGDEVDRWLGRYKRPAKPEPEPASAPVPAAKPARPEVPASQSVEELRKLQTETLVNRLGVRIEAQQRELIVGLVAGRMAWDWNDGDSIGGFKSRLRLIGPAAGDLKPSVFLKAWRAGNSPKAKRPGAIFHESLTPHLPEGWDRTRRA